jgi:heterodisulfide reductase subunit A-like polyferredoxin
MPNESCIIVCRCGAGLVSDEKLRQISEDLHSFDADVIELRDLCAFSVTWQVELSNIGKKYQRKVVVACYPRAVKNMFRQFEVDFGEFEVVNFKELGASEILSKIVEDNRIGKGEASYRSMDSGLEVPAWFPVIDQSKCTLCGKCARFCLFGVYRFDRKSLEVVAPLNCKNNCPACGRTCPASAIMFPRLPENTVLAGAEPGEPSNAAAKESLFVLLNERNRSRSNIFRDGLIQQAEMERQKALDEIQKLTTKK